MLPARRRAAYKVVPLTVEQRETLYWLAWVSILKDGQEPW